MADHTTLKVILAAGRQLAGDSLLEASIQPRVEG